MNSSEVHLDEASESTGGSHVLSAVLSSAFHIALDAIETSRRLMDQAQTRAPTYESETARRFRELLPASGREAARRAVESFEKEFDEASERLLLDLEREYAATGPDPESLYPLSREWRSASVRLATEELFEQLFRKHFGSIEDGLEVQYALMLLRESDNERMDNFLGQALLPKLIASFEEFISALLRTGLERYPRALGNLPDIPFSIVEKYGANVSTNDLRRWAIDKKVSSLIAGSPDEWRTKIKSWTKIDFADLGADWGAVLESIQRRHALIHNAGIADVEYVQRVDQRFLTNVRVGSALYCDSRYMDELLAEFEILVQMLALKWAGFMKLDAFSVFPMLIDAIVELERRRRWVRAELLCRTALTLGQVADERQRDILRINWWFCRQEIGGEGTALRSEIESWQPSDETTFLGKAALLRNKDELTSLITKMLNTPQQVANRRYLRNMPLVIRAMEDVSEVGRMLTPNVPRQRSSGRRPKRKR